PYQRTKSRSRRSPASAGEEEARGDVRASMANGQGFALSRTSDQSKRESRPNKMSHRRRSPRELHGAHAPDDIRISQCVEDRGDPKISGSPVQDPKEQTDHEDEREHW